MLNDLLKDPGVIPPNFSGGKANLGTILTDLFSIAFYIAAFMSFLWLVWAAYQYILAQGNKEELAKARARMTYAIIGLIVIIMALVVARFAQEIIRPRFGTPII